MTQTAQRAPSLLRERGLIRYVVADGLSVAGDNVWLIGIAWAAALHAPSASAASLVVASATVPQLVLALVGGTVVDRWGPWVTSIGSDAIKVVLMGLVCAALALGLPLIPVLIIAGLLYGCVSSVHGPALSALLPSVVEPDLLRRATGLAQAVSRAGVIVGAPLGGVVAALGGVFMAAWINGLSFVLSAILLTAARRAAHRVGPPEAAERGGFWQQARAGLTYLKGNSLVRTLLLTGAAVNFGVTGPLGIGLPLLSREAQWGSRTLGILVAGIGIGGAVAALAMARDWSIARPARTAMLVLAAQALALGSLGAAPHPAVGIALTLLVGVTASVASVLLLTLVQQGTDPSYLGRVMSVAMLLNVGAAPAAIFGFGVLVDLSSARTAIGICGGLELIAVVAALSKPAVRLSTLGSSGAS